MARFVPEFLGSQSTSQFSGESQKDHLMEVQKEDPRANVVEPDAPFSPSRSQAFAHSVRRTPRDPKGLESVSFRVPMEPSALM